MLQKSLKFLEKQLKTGITPGDGGQENITISSVVNDAGKYIQPAGTVSLSLVNIEEERFLKAQVQIEKRNGDQVQFANPEIKLNLLIMLAANPGENNYSGALDRLSEAITFFQGTNFFEKIKYPELAPDIEQLSVELYSLSIDQQNQLWASLGAKYIPSVLYKVRLVVINQGLFGGKRPVIKVIDNDLKKIS